MYYHTNTVSLVSTIAEVMDDDYGDDDDNDVVMWLPTPKEQTQTLEEPPSLELEIESEDDSSSQEDNESPPASSGASPSSGQSLVTLLGRSVSLKYTLLPRPQKNKNNKNVRFAHTMEGELERQVYHYEPCSRTLQERQELWWTAQEIQQIRNEANQIVCFLKEDDGYLWAMHIWCRKHNPSFSSVCSSKKSDLIQARSLLESFWDDCRGLEMRIESNYFIDSIAKHRAVTLGTFRATRCEHVVRREAKATSQASSVYALALAEMDANEVTVLTSDNNWCC